MTPGRRSEPPEFDPVAATYDRSRPPLAAAEADALAEGVRRFGLTSLLEAGIGTGRIAGPLAERGIRMCGLDLSLGMMAQARRRGLDRLVRGSIFRMPFRSASVDAVLLVHVLHLLETPDAVLAEAGRVGRQGILAVLRPAAPAPEVVRALAEAQSLFLRHLAEEGYSASVSPHPGPQVEARLVRENPPDRSVAVSDRSIDEPLVESLRLHVEGGSRHTVGVPEAVRRRAFERARGELEGRRLVRRERYELVWWATRRPRL